MMKLLFSLLFLFFCEFISAQTLQGLYTGEMKVNGRKQTLALQVDLMEENGLFSAVVRSRELGKMPIGGCDNWLEGKFENKTLVLQNKATLKETEVPPNACNQILEILNIKVNASLPEPELTGNWITPDNEIFGKFTLTRIDTANSYSVQDEKETAMRKMGEIMIASTFDDSLRIDMMQKFRGVEWVDTFEIKALEASLKIQAPEADIFHKITVLMNGNPIVINQSPRQKGINVKMKEMAEGDVEILLICYHAINEVMYNASLTLLWGEQEKLWTIPVSTFRNRGVVIRFTHPDP